MQRLNKTLKMQFSTMPQLISSSSVKCLPHEEVNGDGERTEHHTQCCQHTL